jgi:nucleotide-binding universal stress UspA family protein
MLERDCRATLNGTPCALGVAPLAYALAPHRLHRLGVGYDGSPESEAAVRVARALAAAHAGVIKPLAQLRGTQGVAVHGGPREELVQAGKELDLLIVGSRGYGPIGRLFHGGVSRYLVGHATCPLLVLPCPATKGEQPEGERDARALSAVGGPGGGAGFRRGLRGRDAGPPTAAHRALRPRSSRRPGRTPAHADRVRLHRDSP